MRKSISPAVALIVVVAVLVGVGAWYVWLWQQEKPLSKGAITPDQAPPINRPIKPSASAR